MRRFFAFIAIVLALTCAVRADEPGAGAGKPVESGAPVAGPSVEPSAKPAGEPGLQAYGDWNRECVEWTDSCALCKRGEGNAIVCSTPGIACQPKGIVCLRRAGSPSAK